jgi:hypothetical protein
MLRISTLTAMRLLLFAGGIALSGCSGAPQEPPPPSQALAVAPPSPPPPPAKPPVAEKPNVMFDSDPNGEWNVFPDPTTGEVGIYHKGEYLGKITGNEKDDPPEPHKDPRDKPPEGD